MISLLANTGSSLFLGSWHGLLIELIFVVGIGFVRYRMEHVMKQKCWDIMIR